MTETFVPFLSEPVNLRDLGGLPVAGGVIAPGFAIRSDDLATITPEAAQRLSDDGLTAIIDLRSRGEVAATGRGPLGEHEASFYHIPFMTQLKASALPATAPGEMPNMADYYPMLWERVAPRIVSALGVIAFSPGAVAFHCAAGRDRTGVLAAALLLALGADDDTIIADYERTHPNLDAIMARTRPNLAPVLAAAGFNIDQAAQAASQTVEDEGAMRAALITLRERHGDPLAPLRGAGLNDRLVGQLRERAGLAA